MARKSGEILEPDHERLGAEAGELRARGLRVAVEAEQEPEFSDVAEYELVRAILETHDQPCVLVALPPRVRERELAGHLQMEDKRPAALELDEEHLAPPTDAEDAPAQQRLEPLRARPEQGAEEKLDPRNTRPRIAGSRVRAIVSTSGSSGIGIF